MKIQSEIILAERQKLEKELLRKFKISAIDLAEYFDAPTKSINEDMRDIGKVKAGTHSADIDRLIDIRNTRLSKDLDGSAECDRAAILATYGLWREPKDHLHPQNTDILKYLQKESDIKAMTLIETGVRFDNAYKQVGGVSAQSRTIIEGFISKNKIKTGHAAVEQDNEATAFATAESDKLLKANKDMGVKHLVHLPQIETIGQVTGVSHDRIKDYLAGHGKSGLYDGENKYYTYRGTEQTATNKDEKETLKWEIYNTWTAGKATQQELADKYKCTRATIMNYCDYCKSVTIDDQLKNIPTVRRRISNAKVRARIAERDAVIISAFHEAGDNAAKACKSLGASGGGGETTKVYNTLRKHGLITSKYERSQLETLESASVESERVQSLNVNAIFGYGPNQGKTKEGRKVYAKVHENQVATNYELKRSPEFRQHVNESAGEMTNYFIPKNTRARNEYVKKYPTSKIAAEEKAKALVRKKGSPTTEINEPEI